MLSPYFPPENQMSYNTDKQILGDLIDVIFEPGETIKMVCRPQVKSFYLNQIRGVLIILLIFGSTLAVGMIVAYLSGHHFDWRQTMLYMLGPIALLLSYVSFHSIKEAGKITYIITDLSIIIYKDLRIQKTIVINKRDIQTKELTKTFIDKHLGTGTIQLFTGKMDDNDGTPQKVYDYISSVTEPEKVFALV